MVNRSLHQEDTIVINVCAPNSRASKYMKQKLIGLKGEMKSNTVIIGAFNIPLSVMYGSTRPKINKKTEDLKT